MVELEGEIGRKHQSLYLSSFLLLVPPSRQILPLYSQHLRAQDMFDVCYSFKGMQAHCIIKIQVNFVKEVKIWWEGEELHELRRQTRQELCRLALSCMEHEEARSTSMQQLYRTGDHIAWATNSSILQNLDLMLHIVNFCLSSFASSILYPEKAPAASDSCLPWWILTHCT